MNGNKNRHQAVLARSLGIAAMAILNSTVLHIEGGGKWFAALIAVLLFSDAFCRYLETYSNAEDIHAGTIIFSFIITVLSLVYFSGIAVVPNFLGLLIIIFIGCVYTTFRYGRKRN